MTMLPTPLPPEGYRERVLAVITNSPYLLAHIRPIFAIPEATSSASHVVTAPAENVDALWFSASETDTALLQVCDASLFILSASEGVSQDLIDVWKFCEDHSIPGHLAITDLYDGYADFDETVAVLRRALGAEIQTPFLPMADDDANSMAGILDLISGEILEYSATSTTRRSAEQEHLDLTRDERLQLLDSIAALALQDTDLKAHQSGIQLPTVTYYKALQSNNLTTVTPFEGTNGVELINNWMMCIESRWFPEIVTQENVIHVPERFGIGITHGFARMWGEHGHDLHLVEVSNGDVKEVGLIASEIDVHRCCLLDPRIISDSVLYSGDNRPDLVAPAF